MTHKFNSGLIIIGIFSLLFSCSRSITPVRQKDGRKIKFDAAAYNYFYVEALKQKLMGNDGDALKYLEQCVKLNPQSDAAYYQMSQVVTSNGDVAHGKFYLKKALSIDKENIWYLSMLGGLYYQEKSLDSAIIYYERAVKYHPEKENVMLTLGNLYSEDKKYDKAAEVFENFDSKYGVNEMSTVSSIRNLVACKKYDEALVKLRTLSGEYPDNVAYRGLMADLYKDKNEFSKAEDEYDNALKKFPDNGPLMLGLCDLLSQEKKFDDMMPLLNTVVLNSGIEINDKVTLMANLIDIPEIETKYSDKMTIVLMVLEATYNSNALIPLLRTDFLVKQNRLPEAESRLKELVSNNPDNYYAWEKLLFVYLQQKDYEKLYKTGEECATKFNTSYPAKLLYANAAMELKKYDVALDELKKAEILAASNKEFMVQVLTMRADVYYRMKDYSKAFDTFETAIKTDNSDLTVINNYAYYLAEQNRNLKEAEEMARKVIEAEKTNTTFLDTYGWVLYKRKKYQEAAKVMESIIKSGDKSDAVWYEHYGYILQKQKKCREAIESWNTALKIDSTKTELKKEIENCEK